MAGEIELIAKIKPKNDAFTGIVDSSQSVVETGSFSGNLSGADNSAQKAFTTLDKLSIGGLVSQGDLTEFSSSVLNIVSGTNAVIGSGTQIQVNQATLTQSGYLSTTDWNTFNDKVSLTGEQILTNKTLPAISGSSTVIAGDLSVLGTIYGNVSAAASDHNTLANLQGGTTSQYYHLSQADYNNRVTTDGVQTLTNKTIGDNLIISGTLFGNSATFNTQLIYPVTPSEDSEVANKAYVDAQISGENFWDRDGAQLTPHYTGDSIAISGTLFSQQTETTNLTVGNLANFGNIQTATENITGNIEISGTTFAQQIESTGINVGGNLNVNGNITGNITDVTFGDITTTSIANSGNIFVSGTIFGDGSGISNVVTLNSAQTLNNKTIPVISGSQTVITGNLSVFGNIYGNLSAAGGDTEVQFNSNGILGANSGLSFDSDTNLTVNDIVNVTLDEDSLRGGLKIKHSKSSVGSSEYYFVQDSYDILQIKRSGDTTGDGNYFSIVDIISPSIALDDVDSEATIALTTRRGTPTTVTRTLDIYNDEYARDNGMGFRQLYKNTTPNPIRFEFHNKTTGNGKFTLNDCYAYVGNFHLDYVTADVTGVIPEVDDWIWDNAATILPDDTKIISIETGVPNPAATRLHLNKAVLVEGEAVSFRGVNVKEIMRLTPARQLLVRKFLASTSGTVAEFGGSMVADGNIITSGTYFGNGSGLSNVVFPNAVQTLTNKTLPAISGSQTVIAGDLSVLGTIYGNVSASASDHNTLANLQGGSSTERYHLTQTEHDTIVLTDSTQTLTNKTIGDNLVVSGTTYAQKIYSAGGGVSGDLLVSGTLTANRIIGGLGSRLGSSDVYLQLNDFPLAGGSIPLLTGFNNTPQGPGSPPPTLWGIEGLFGVIETSGEPDTYTGMYFSNHNASKIVLLGYFPDSNLILMGDLLGGTEIIVSSAIFASTTTTNPPFGVASSILVSDLNSDLWDGYQFSDYLDQPVLTTSNITLGSGTFTGNVVCSGTYFGDASGLSNLPSSGTTDHAALSNLNWVSAGHTFDTNLDVGSNNIVTSGTIFGEGTGLRNIITGDDIEISDNSNGVILKSPSGIRWRLTVNDSGIVSATSL